VNTMEVNHSSDKSGRVVDTGGNSVKAVRSDPSPMPRTSTRIRRESRSRDLRPPGQPNDNPPEGVDRKGGLSHPHQASATHGSTVLLELTTPLWQAARIVRGYVEHEALRHANLTWTEYMVLQEICACRRVKTVTVAERVGITKGTLTGVVVNLHGRGLVRRHVPPVDRRQILLTPTAVGLDLASRSSAAVSTAEQQVLRDPATTSALLDLTHRIGQLTPALPLAPSGA
jgi:DNA-binding MarR family transcriptional regulator